MTDLDRAVAALSSRRRDAARDKEAWNEVFRQTWSYVLTLSLRQVGELADAEDLAQSVFLKLIDRWKNGQITIESPAALRTLMAVTTRRLATDRHRYLHRQRRDDQRRIVSTESVQSLAGPSGDDTELNELLGIVLRQLDETEQLILESRIQGYTHAEIAKKLSFSTRTIERKMAGIRQLLSQYFDLEP